jgi:hypothetical protein
MTPSLLQPRTALVLMLCLLCGAVAVATQKSPSQQAAAQKPTAAQRVPITFNAPHDYAATVDYLKKVAAANPGLTDLVEIGKSSGKSPIYVLVITNMKTGTPMDKLVALTHPRTPAVDNVLPMKPYHAKPGQWMDGGMRGADSASVGACLFVIDRLLSGYGGDAEITRLVDDNAFYVCPIVNADAFTVAPGPGPAVASNFPEGWWKDDNTPGGEGDYPSSLPEARAVLEFFTNHPNILLVQSFDAAGGAALRPFARWPEGRVDARDVAVLDGVIGKKYQELSGAGPRAAWRPAYNTEKQAPSGYGVFIDWAYGQFGAFAMATPPSAGSAAAAEQAFDTAWQFERYKATLLPRVQIKDATAKVLYTTNSASRATATESADAVIVKKSGAPGRYKVVQVTATVENTGALPTQVARGPELRGNRQDVIWLLGDRTKVTFLEGTRWQPLGVLQGTLPLPRATGPEGGRGGRGGAPGGGRGGRGGETGLALSQMREQRPSTPPARQAGSTRTVSWLVAVEGDTPLKLALTSLKGGTITRDLAIQ